MRLTSHDPVTKPTAILSGKKYNYNLLLYRSECECVFTFDRFVGGFCIDLANTHAHVRFVARYA